MRKYGLAMLAAFGVIAIIAAIVVDSRPAVLATTATTITPAPDAKPPFAAFVAGTGIVEPLGGSIAVGTPVAGIVTAVEVRPGDKVIPGGVLFRIDDADLQAQRPALAAAENEARERLTQAGELYRLALAVPDKRAISEEEIMSRRSAVKVANAALASYQARSKQVDAEAARRIVRARVAGEVLQVNLRPGEFAQPGAGRPPILMAAGARLALRVDVDEVEAGRVRHGAAAVASPRGSAGLRIPLKFERIEPSIVARTSLAGSGTERIDSRVLQVIYSFAPGEAALVGQQMDVTIEAGGAGTAR
ncbi:MAG: secretion protein HlyD [Massilia sp.]|nr:secretion protein HlyD [Massilia sp.]